MYNYVNPILQVCKKTDFTQDMHYQLAKEDKVENYLAIFQENWSKLLKKNYDKIRNSYFSINKPDLLLKCIWKTHFNKYVICLFLTVVYTACKYINCILMYKTLESFNEDKNGKIIIIVKQFIILMSVLVVTKILFSILKNKLEFELGVLGFKIKNTMQAMILTKSIKKSITREKEYTIGKMLN